MKSEEVSSAQSRGHHDNLLSSSNGRDKEHRGGSSGSNAAAGMNELSRRQKIVKEILSTEKTYVRALECVVKDYMLPLKQLASKSPQNGNNSSGAKSPQNGINAPGAIVSIEHINDIFSNIDRIYSINQEFLGSLTPLVNDFSDTTTMLGPLFLQMAPKFDHYMEYVVSHKISILTVHKYQSKKTPKFREFCDERQAETSERLGLPALLIQPVQRIPRYQLLLSDLLKNTPPTHPDFKHLQRALSEVAGITGRVNQQMEEHENSIKLNKIQKSFVGNIRTIIVPSRRFVREGPLIKVCRKVAKKRWFWLFNDCIVYGSIVGAEGEKNRRSPGTSVHLRDHNTSKRFTFHQLIDIDPRFKVQDVPDAEHVKFGFQILSSQKSFTVHASTQIEKDGWLGDIKAILTKDTKIVSLAASTSSAGNGAVANAPIWVSDGSTSRCQICKTQFTLIKRRHHCRSCGKVVCGTCSSKKMELTKLAVSDTSVRVCDTCFDVLQKEKEADSPGSEPTTPLSPRGGTPLSPRGGTPLSPRGGTPLSPRGGTPLSPRGGTTSSPRAALTASRGVGSSPDLKQSGVRKPVSFRRESFIKKPIPKPEEEVIKKVEVMAVSKRLSRFDRGVDEVEKANQDKQTEKENEKEKEKGKEELKKESVGWGGGTEIRTDRRAVVDDKNRRASSFLLGRTRLAQSVNGGYKQDGEEEECKKEAARKEEEDKKKQEEKRREEEEQRKRKQLEQRKRQEEREKEEEEDDDEDGEIEFEELFRGGMKKFKEDQRRGEERTKDDDYDFVIEVVADEQDVKARRLNNSNNNPNKHKLEKEIEGLEAEVRKLEEELGEGWQNI